MSQIKEKQQEKVSTTDIVYKYFTFCVFSPQYMSQIKEKQQEKVSTTDIVYNTSHFVFSLRST